MLVLWDVVKLHTAHLQLITFSVLLTKVIACLPKPHLRSRPETFSHSEKLSLKTFFCFFFVVVIRIA